MKRWLLPIGSLAAIAVGIVAVLAVVGVFDGDGASSAEGPEAAGLCVEGQPDCVDTVVGNDSADDDEGTGDAINQVCAPGEPNCVDTNVDGGPTEEDGSGEGTSIAPVCAPGHPDCADTIVVTNGDSEGDSQ